MCFHSQLSSVVEQRFCKPSVVGSNPTAGSIFKWLLEGWFGKLEVVLCMKLCTETLEFQKAPTRILELRNPSIWSLVGLEPKAYENLPVMLWIPTPFAEPTLFTVPETEAAAVRPLECECR